MPSLPEGEAAPLDGRLPQPDVSGGFSAYVHIPFCAVRCGYCDFNTYSNLHLGPGAQPEDFPASLRGEIDLSRRVLEWQANSAQAGQRGGPSAVGGATALRSRGDGLLRTVFFGGGTPTLLDAQALVDVLDMLRENFGLVCGAEVTTEANPESVTRDSIRRLADGGFTRISFGMQSAVPHVLRTLDRWHTPGQVGKAVTWAQEAGLDVSVDLIYGTPGETEADWRASLAAAVAMGPSHISAYALTVEPDTRMGGRIRRGEIAAPDPDRQAAFYEIADHELAAAHYGWYEISNWAQPGHASRHNLAYWTGGNWWGYGPGAHSFIGGTRFWNVKHPLAYAQRVAAGQSPSAARETLTEREQREEAIMLGIRLAEGIAVPQGTESAVVAGLIADGLVDPRSALRGRLRLTLRGRLLADTVTRALW
ncbi:MULTISPECIES: radical SAM family heme chaperone HemW [unclassified Actinobaculum]|uniref:radical SAM family heme chaperone HemW n=1 Tax=unclassified Actinobaculum TaxID=2609299 RepID=UPI000D528FFF|nr:MULTISPECIES: radical SAM family heme chaperone HemW [unclassified Actinobaculum]AWE42291.1 coproporphyrinogen III oxidase [Actinobaculum sp. 313]RTE50861.1 coproporphyrinogen III oxidase [Actinobaculum sp. 352]